MSRYDIVRRLQIPQQDMAKHRDAWRQQHYDALPNPRMYIPAAANQDLHYYPIARIGISREQDLCIMLTRLWTE